MNTELKIGDEVQLKTPENGRYFRGKVGKINEKTAAGAPAAVVLFSISR